jgi:hypothetical protein
MKRSMRDGITTIPAHDPDSRYAGPDGARIEALPPRTAQERKNAEEARQVLRQLEDWWQEGRDMHADNRREQFIDSDFYDGDQFDPETRAELEARGQAPLVYNIIHPTIQWVVGTERRTRIDWKVLARGSEDVGAAEAKTSLLKYAADANNAGWERSAAFKDAVRVGVGWTEEFLRTDALEEELGIRHQAWQEMWWDPFARQLNMQDCRWIDRNKYIDLDYAIAMFPEHADALRGAAVQFAQAEEDAYDDWDLPGVFQQQSRPDDGRRRFLGVTGNTTRWRMRVRIHETWFKRPKVEKRVRSLVQDYADLNGQVFDPEQPMPEEIAKAKERGVISLVDSLTDTMWQAFWIPGTLLGLKRSPYRHNRFPFTPIWCYRRHRDGMPYGLIRMVRDPQEDYNKRRGKALFAMSTHRVLFEEDAFNEDDEDEGLEQATMPNGQVRLRAGGLNKVKIDTMSDVAKGHLELAEQSKTQILETSGVTRDNLGQDSSAASGKAILAKQQQGAVVTAEVFDNYRLAIQLSGQKMVSIIEQYVTLPKQIRILGPHGNPEFLMINEPVFDPATGEVWFENDVTRGMADFIVDQQDYRETARMAMAEQLFEMVGRLPPEMAIQLMDLPLELSDIPNKAEFIRRVRMMNGMEPAPEDPNAAADQAAQQQAQQRQQQLADELAAAKIEKERAGAENLRAQAASKRVEGRGKAIDVAGMAASAIPLVPAADRLYEPPQAPQLPPSEAA